MVREAIYLFTFSLNPYCKSPEQYIQDLAVTCSSELGAFLGLLERDLLFWPILGNLQPSLSR